ncbi:hypothetical protein ABZP36_032346 [Zizania latifolia]
MHGHPHTIPSRRPVTRSSSTSSHRLIVLVGSSPRRSSLLADSPLGRCRGVRGCGLRASVASRCRRCSGSVGVARCGLAWQRAAQARPTSRWPLGWRGSRVVASCRHARGVLLTPQSSPPDRKSARHLKTLGSRHKIAGEIDELKARVISVRDQKNSYKIDDTFCSSSNNSNASVDPRLAALFAEENHLVGIEGPRDELINWLDVESRSMKHRKVLSIVGFGGLGKTTLANEVYRRVKAHFDCTAFTSVSQKPDMKKIFKDIIDQMPTKDEFLKDIDTWDAKKFIEKLRELLVDKSYKLQSLHIHSNISLEFLDRWFPLPCFLRMFWMTTDYYFPQLPMWVKPSLTNMADLIINLVEIKEEELKTLGELPALLCLEIWLEADPKKQLTVQSMGFACLKEFVLVCRSLEGGAYLTFEKGAMPKLEKLELPFHVLMAKSHGFYFGINNLLCLKEAVVRIYGVGVISYFGKDESDTEAATAAIMNEAKENPNHPRIAIITEAIAVLEWK